MNRRVFALLDNNVVQDFIVGYNLDYAVGVAKNLYINGDAIDCTNIDCGIGDIYDSGAVYHSLNNDIRIEIVPEYCTEGYESNIEKSLNNAKNRISFLENILHENGLDKLIT